MCETCFSYANYASLKKIMKNIVKKSPLFFFSSILLQANEQKASITSPYNIMILGQREITTTMGMNKLRKVRKIVKLKCWVRTRA